VSRLSQPSGLVTRSLIWTWYHAAEGFGLAVPPTLHRLLTACGIRDCSATIKGSRNPMQTLKAAIQILHGGVSVDFASEFLGLY
jgi:small subunit ribosomal protein S5